MIGNYAWAMGGVLSGARMRRQDWNRPEAVFLGAVQIGDHFQTQVLMRMKTGLTNAYVPSQCDMLATDWYCVDQRNVHPLKATS